MNQAAQSDYASKRKANPVLKANLLSQLGFWWLREMFVRGMRGTIHKEDIYATKDYMQSAGIAELMLERWQLEQRQPKPSLLRVLVKHYGWPVILWGAFFMLAETVSRVAQPLCLGGLVGYFAPGQTEYTLQDAYLFCAGIILTSASIILTFHPFMFWLCEQSAVIRLGCSGMLYRKVMQLPRSAVSDGLNGKLINLLSNDVTRFEYALLFLHDVWKGPAETILFCWFIYREIGWAAVIGIGFLLSFIPLQAWIGKKAATLRLKTAKRTDYRVKIMNEIIQGIQVIKMYAWENSFAAMVDKIRKKEIVAVRRTAFVRATLTSLGMISRISIFISLIAYIFMGNLITARKVFIVSSYFGILNYSMMFQWTYSLTCVAEGYISVQRVQAFLQMSEHKLAEGEGQTEDPSSVDKKAKKFAANIVREQTKEVGASVKLQSPVRRIQTELAPVKQISFENVTARWTSDDDGSAGITELNLHIGAGELCAVIGQVGAGKSTLLQVLLGELSVDEGRLQIDGTISYAAQEAWLFESSIRANIVFIEEYDEKRYKEVVRVCALERDFQLLPNGDATIVGERGISLSGGQKARINLARAVYKQADIYLLDDPLSAVDTHVGKHMFHECIRGFLGDKICVLITHQLQHLTEARRVVVLNKSRIEMQGTYAELREQNCEALMATPDESGAEAEQKKKKAAELAKRQRSNSGSSTGSALDVDDEIVGGEQADRTEHSNEGTVDWSVYGRFLKAVNNNFYVFIIFLMFIVAQMGVSGVDYFVAQWVNWEESLVTVRANGQMLQDLAARLWGGIETTVEEHRTHYIITYCVLMLVTTYIFVHRAFAFYALCLRATTNIHDLVFRGISRTTMFFYNTNPSGRILNRFSKDISNIDVLLPPAMMESLATLFECLAILVLVVTVNYILIIPTLILVVLIYCIRQCYIKTARCIKRIESVSFSPVYSHANATLQGLTTVRAFRANAVLQHEFHRHLDINTGDWYMRVATTRAFAFWLDIVCLMYIAAVTLSFVAMNDDTIRSGNVGLAILQCINMVGMCQWGIRQTAEVESQMTSVERLMEYANLPAEAALESAVAQKPPADWPSTGKIEFKQLSFRYTPDGTFVLRDLELSIEAKEKIGIVGRTGAGKSSLIQALFRLAELDGAIVIDGIETNKLGLHDLRRNISIIPQDPVLFSGTLRFNLDPFAERTDEQLWRALEQVELKAVVADMIGGLDCRMMDGGSNFSVGQRQMVCLARAILRNNKILILDEATANVDPETDRLIQTTIRKRFSECTVLTIAHRLHTVMDSDRVLVVDAGRAMEFGHPHELLSGGQHLRQLVDQTGPETAAILMGIAEKNYAEKTKTE